MALTNGDLATGRRYAEEALKLHRSLGDAWGIAFTLLMYAYVVGQEGNWPRAQQLYDESARRFRACDDQHYALRATRSLAWAHREGGDLDRARGIDEDLLRQARALNDPLLEGVTLSHLADYATADGRLDDAISLQSESHRILTELNDPLLVAASSCRFAHLFAVAGRARTATRLLSSSMIQLEALGARPPWLVRITEQTLTAIRTTLDDEAFAEAWEQGRALTPDESLARAFASDPVAIGQR